MFHNLSGYFQGKNPDLGGVRRQFGRRPNFGPFFLYAMRYFPPKNFSNLLKIEHMVYEKENALYVINHRGPGSLSFLILLCLQP